MIAFLGTGRLGHGFVRAFLRRGEGVNAWNRSIERARPLEEDGARVFVDARDAVRSVSRVHLCLSDDSAVDDVLERVRDAISPGAMILDHTTTSPSGTRARHARWTERGALFLHAPVFMGPQNALESTGTMMVSGDRVRVAAARPHLEAMTGKLVDLGERVDAAASFKLLGNLFLMFLTSGFADMLALAKALDVPAADTTKLLDFFNPGQTLPARLRRMLDAETIEASWELGMARKDARLMLDEASQAGVPLAVLPAIAARMDAVIAEGFTRSDWTILAKDALRSR